MSQKEIVAQWEGIYWLILSKAIELLERKPYPKKVIHEIITQGYTNNSLLDRRLFSIGGLTTQNIQEQIDVCGNYLTWMSIFQISCQGREDVSPK